MRELSTHHAAEATTTPPPRLPRPNSASAAGTIPASARPWAGRAAGAPRRVALVGLSESGRFGRLVRFGAVGVSGLAVNLLALAVLLITHLGSRVVGGDILSAIIATQLAVAWNFGLTERWVFRGQRGHWMRRLLPFWMLSCAALVAQLPLAAMLQPLLDGSYLMATGAAVCLLMVTRFAVCDLWLYPRRTTVSHRVRPTPDPAP